MQNFINRTALNVKLSPLDCAPQVEMLEAGEFADAVVLLEELAVQAGPQPSGSLHPTTTLKPETLLNPQCVNPPTSHPFDSVRLIVEAHDIAAPHLRGS